MSKGPGLSYDRLNKLSAISALADTDLLFVSEDDPTKTEKSVTFGLFKSEVAKSFEPVHQSTIYVDEESDIPTNLVPNTNYDIRKSIFIGRDLIIPDDANITFTNQSFGDITITYTGSGVFLKGVNVGLFNAFRLIFANSGTGTFLNADPGASPLAQIALDSCLIQGWADVGLWTIKCFLSGCAFVNNIIGLKVANAIDSRINTSIMFNTSDLGTTFIDFGGTSKSTGKLLDVTITTFPTETGLKYNSTIGADSIHRIDDSSITGDGAVLDPAGINQKDKRLLVGETTGISNSVHIGAFSVEGNAATTLPGVVDTFVDIVFSGAGLAVDSALSERLSVTNTANGEQTYNGIDPQTFVLLLKLSGTSGTANKLFGIKYVVDRGAGYIDLPDNSIEEEEFTNKLRSNTFIDTILLNPGDKIKPQVANTETDGVTYVFSAAKQQVHKVG